MCTLYIRTNNRIECTRRNAALFCVCEGFTTCERSFEGFKLNLWTLTWQRMKVTHFSQTEHHTMFTRRGTRMHSNNKPGAGQLNVSSQTKKTVARSFDHSKLWVLEMSNVALCDISTLLCLPVYCHSVERMFFRSLSLVEKATQPKKTYTMHVISVHASFSHFVSYFIDHTSWKGNSQCARQIDKKQSYYVHVHTQTQTVHCTYRIQMKSLPLHWYANHLNWKLACQSVKKSEKGN